MDRLLSRLANGLMLVFAGYFVFSWLHSVGGLWVILAVLVGLCLLPFVVGPVILHQTQKISLQTNLVPFDPEGPGSPELLRSHFATTRADLLRLGFTPERYYQAKNAHSHAEGWVLLFRNRITGETARILTSVGVAADASVSIGTSFLVLASEFTDGTVIVTSNRTSAWILPPRKPPYHGQAFPRVPEVGRLRNVHRARVALLAPGRIAVDLVRNDPDAYLHRVDFAEPLAYQVACGYHRNDEVEGVQRMTWKGAILTTGKLLPPIAQIRLFGERIQAARALKRLERNAPWFATTPTHP